MEGVCRRNELLWQMSNCLMICLAEARENEKHRIKSMFAGHVVDTLPTVYGHLYKLLLRFLAFEQCRFHGHNTQPL